MKNIASIFIILIYIITLSSCTTPEQPEPDEFDPSKNYLYGKSVSGTILDVVVVRSDGSVYNTSTSTTSAPLINQVKEIAGGGKHTIALKEDGTVWSWGGNDYGQLGDGSTMDNTYRTIPVQVNGISNCIAVSGGSAHSLALLADGTVWAWGYNEYAQLGDSSTTHRNVPVKVKQLSGAIAISAGGLHSVALKADGTVWVWGGAVTGNAGIGTFANETAAVQANGLSGITKIAAGIGNTYGIKNDKTVWGYGINQLGQLGNGTTTTAYTPVQMLTVNDALSIAAGNCKFMAIRSDSTVWACGDNYHGNLGDGTTTGRSIPVQALNLKKIKAISCRWNYNSTAIESNGLVWAWGKTGLTGSTTSPIRVEMP
jgi:alpha-tubulin suppressor-like RCC1 family protein